MYDLPEVLVNSGVSEKPAGAITMVLDVRLETGSPSALQPADPRMGAGLAASHSEALARAGRDQRPGPPARVRSRLLSLSGQCPGGRSAQSPLHLDLRVRQRFRGAEAGNAAGAIRERGTADSRVRAGPLPGGLLLSATQLDHRQHAAARPAEGRGYLGGAVWGTWAATVDRVRADFREPRRHDGGQQSAPALPDLVEPRAAQRGREGTGVATGVGRNARHLPAVRVPETGAGVARPDRRRERDLLDRSSLLGRVAF